MPKNPANPHAKRRQSLRPPASTMPTLAMNSLVQNNIVQSRLDLMRSILDDRRDINEECGYPEHISLGQYRRMYDRGLGRRVVNIYPEECWKQLPDIYEDADPDTSTPFEAALAELDDAQHILHYMHRIDELSGIGRFGIMLLGIDDGLTLDQPAAGLGEDGKPSGEPRQGAELTYVRCLDESMVTVSQIQTDTTSRRYGMPLYYQLTLVDPYEHGNGLPQQERGQLVKVHWTRCVHIADNRTTSEVLGSPRQEGPWDRLYDCVKVLGGSGEMFWRGGFPGLSLETNPSVENPVIDQEATRQAIWDYMNGLQRYLALDGMSAKSLQTQISDPTPSLEVHIKAICIIIGVPYPVFVGALEGQLAGDQNANAWDGRVQNRRDRYVTPMVIRPVLWRLVHLGILPPPAEGNKIEVKWPDTHEPSDSDNADLAGKQTEALAKYLAGGVDTLVPPLEYLTQILKMDDDVAQQILDAAFDRIEDIEDDDAVTPGRLPTPEGLQDDADEDEDDADADADEDDEDES